MPKLWKDLLRSPTQSWEGFSSTSIRKVAELARDALNSRFTSGWKGLGSHLVLLERALPTRLNQGICTSVWQILTSRLVRICQTDVHIPWFSLVGRARSNKTRCEPSPFQPLVNLEFNASRANSATFRIDVEENPSQL